MAKKIYCVDTSALIAAWYERYKPNRFPKLWGQLGQLINDGRLISSTLSKIPGVCNATKVD
jgi:hypothetical protein